MTKRCSKCKKIKDISEFYTDKRNSDGHRNPCKTCYAIDTKKYNEENIKERKIKSKIRRSTKEYKNMAKEKMRRLRSEKPRQYKKYTKDSHIKHKDEINARCRKRRNTDEYRKKNRKYSKEYRDRMTPKQKERRREQIREWRRNNPEKLKKYYPDINWIDEEKFEYRGYIFIKPPEDYYHKGFYGFVAEHRIIAEEKIGRRIKKNEVVHHKDGIRNNNNPDNLQVLTKSKHDKIPKMKKVA